MDKACVNYTWLLVQDNKFILSRQSSAVLVLYPWGTVKYLFNQTCSVILMWYMQKEKGFTRCDLIRESLPWKICGMLSKKQLILRIYYNDAFYGKRVSFAVKVQFKFWLSNLFFLRQKPLHQHCYEL